MLPISVQTALVAQQGADSERVYAGEIPVNPQFTHRRADMTKLIRRIAILFGAPIVTQPDGSVYVRINDRWMPA